MTIQAENLTTNHLSVLDTVFSVTVENPSQARQPQPPLSGHQAERTWKGFAAQTL